MRILFFDQWLKPDIHKRVLSLGLFVHLLQDKKFYNIQKQMSKPSQDQINKLANQPDSDDQVSPKVEEQQPAYQEQFDKEEYEPEEINYQNEEQFQPQDQKESPLNAVSQVQSEIQQENAQEIADQIISQHPSTPTAIDKFKKDQDMSLAKSEFVQSQLLNIDSHLKDKKQQIAKQSSKPKGRSSNQKPKTTQIKREPAKPSQREKGIKIKKQPLKPKSGLDQEKEKKEKLSQSQIKYRMKMIQDEKQALLKKKQQKIKKQEEIKRKQYQQAKKLQQQRKEKNKKILEEQKIKKKADANAHVAKSEMKIDSDQIKMPEKRADYKYMDMVKERKQMEKQIKLQIDQDNKNKLKKILQKPQSELKGQARKAAFLQERKLLKQRQNKQRQLEAKEDDVLIVKQLKKDINQARKFNREKQEQINRADKTIEDLNKKLKQKQKKFYEKYSKGQSASQKFQVNNFSELTPIEKFVYCFPEANTSEQIFKQIDINGDGVLSSQQIKEKLHEYKLQSQVISKVEQLLDENSDGTVSQEEFIFLIDRELKRQKDYRQIMGVLQLNDPLDLEAKIIDMQAKIKFINKKIENNLQNKSEEVYRAKLQKLQKKAKKLEDQWRKQMQNHQENNASKEIHHNAGVDLANQALKLKNQKNMKVSLMEKLKNKVKQNLEDKNKLLASRVQENLRLSEQIFKIKSEIQQRQLRYISLKKIQENKKGYLQRQSQKQKQLQQAYKKTKQYKIAITDPSKKAQIAAERDEMKLLAAVLMIQRNYRKKKARGEFQKLKGQGA